MLALVCCGPRPGELWTYDASKPGPGTRIPLRRSAQGGPWVRPGHAEAIVPVAGQRSWPWQLALLDLRTGEEVRAVSLPSPPYDHGSWHSDGTLFVVDLSGTNDERVAWRLATGVVPIKPRDGVVLGPGDRFVRMDSGYLVSGSTQSWDHLYHDWSVALPL
jgi:hypothetical protein